MKPLPPAMTMRDVGAMGGAVMVLANLAGLTTERDSLASGGIRFDRPAFTGPLGFREP